MNVLYTLLLGGLLTMLAPGLGAQTLSVSLSNEDGAVGEIVCLDFIGENFVDIKGLTFTIQYDTDVLMFSSDDVSLPGVPITVVQDANSPGILRVAGFTPSATGFTSDTNPFDFGDLCFVVLQETPTTVAIIGQPVPILFTNADNVDVDNVTTDGLVNFGDGTMPTCDDGIQNGDETGVDCGGSCVACPTTTVCGADTDDVQICVGSVCADAGAEVCVPVFVGNFDELGGFQFRLAHEAGNLEYTRFNAANDRLTNGTTLLIPSDGLISLSWNDPNLTGLTFPADEPAYEICFTAENELPTPITFFNPSVTLRAFDPIGAEVPVTSSPGAVNVNCGGMMPTCNDGIQNGDETGIDCGGSCQPCMTTGGPNRDCGMGTDDLSVCLGTACDVAVGDEVCIDITVGNFTDVTTLQFDVAFPDANLTYTRVTSNPALSDAITGSTPSTGVARVIFFQFSQAGQSLDDGDNLGTICFTNNTAEETTLSVNDIVAADTDGTVTDTQGNPGSINGCNGGGATCSDGIQNGDETGVDCGGSCQPCADNGGPNRDCGMDTDDLSVCLGTACMVEINDEVCLDITVGNFTDVTTLQFDVTFPDANLTYTRVTSNPALSDAITGSTPGAGTARVIFFQFSQAGQSLDNGDNLGTICFTNNTAERTNLSVENIVAANTSGTITETQGNPGFINGCSTGMPTCDDGIQNGDETGVDCGGSCEPCAVAGDLSFRITDEIAPIGSEVCVDVLASGFANVAAYQFPISFDETKLSFSGANGFGAFNSSTAANPADGELQVSWSADSGGETVSDGTPIFELCFTVLEQCNTSITVEDQAGFPLQAQDAAGANITPIDVIAGTINGGLPCDDSPPPGNIILQLSSEDGTVGQEVCLDLTTTDFDNVTDLTFTLSYDPDIVTFNEAGGFGLAGLAATNVANPTPGIVTFQWSSPTAGGETLADGSTIASFCFTVDSLVSTEVDFIDSPLFTEATNSNGDNVQIVPVSGRINPDAPVVDGLTFIMGDGRGAVGEQVCLPIVGYNLDSLNSFQYTVAYDPAVLSYVGRDPAIMFPLAGDPLVVNSAPGIIRNLYEDPTGLGAIFPADGTPLYGLCFEILVVEPTLVRFTDTPVDIDANDTQGLVDITLIDGEVNGSDAPVILDADENNPTCSDLENGSIVLSVSSAGNTTYQWTGTNATGPIANNLGAGTYSVLITNDAGQSTTRTFTLTAPPPFNIGVDAIEQVTCNGETDGRIVLSTIGGAMPFLIDWGGSLPDGVLEQNDLDAGFYAVTITDGNGCRRQRRQIQIEQPEAIVIAGTVTGTGDDPKAINVVVEGGQGDLRYAWVGPGGFTADTEDIDNLTEVGEYCLTVTDDANCSERACFTIEASNVDLVATATAATVATCSDSPDGRVVLTLTGGRAPFTIVVSPGGEVIMANERTVDIDLRGGDYTFMVTGAGGRSATASATVSAPDAVTGNTVGVSDTEDTGCSGSISLNLSGGSGDYTIVWSNMDTTATITELCAGTYSATVSDANGCTYSTGDITIGELQEDFVNASNASCEDATDGTIDVTISGGASPYTFSWTAAGSDDVIATTEDLAGVATGNYRLTATDASGASIVRLYAVGLDAAFTTTAEVSSDYNGFGVSCADAMDGSITTIVNGEGTFTFEYLLGDVMVGADSILTGAGPGVYTVRVTGDGGCESTRTVTLTAPTAIAVTANILAVSCDDVSDGSITASPAGGVPPYSFAWSTGDTGARVSGLAAGNYSLTVTDGNDCSLIEGFTLDAPEDLAFTFEAIDATEDCNGSIEILPLGGSGTFVYSWPDLPNQGNNPFAQGLCPGDYTVIVTDENECQSLTMVVTVRDRRFPCLSARTVLTPNGDDMNETLVIFCSGDDAAANNTIQIFNRWGQLVYEVDDYDCSDNGGLRCFDGRTNDGAPLSEGAYYYVFDYTNPTGERDQQRGSFTIIRD